MHKYWMGFDVPFTRMDVYIAWAYEAQGWEYETEKRSCSLYAGRLCLSLGLREKANIAKRCLAYLEQQEEKQQKKSKKPLENRNCFNDKYNP